MQSRRPRRSRSIAATSAALVTLACAQAHAQSAEAEKLFSDGTQLLADGKVAQACEAFAASNRAEPRAGTLIALGDCRERNHQLASAWSAFKDALGRVKDPRKKSYATTKVAALEPRLSYLTVQVSDDNHLEGLVVTRDGKPFDALLWNRALPLDGGDYALVARAPGHVDWRTTARVPVEGGKLTVAVPKLELVKARVAATRPEPVAPRPEPVKPAGPPPPVAPSTVVTAPPPAEAPRPGRFTSTRKLAVGLAGLGVASLAAGIVFGVTANNKKDEAFDLCSDPDRPCSSASAANDLISSSHTWATGANIAFGLAAASAAAATILWITGGPSHESHRVSVAPSLTPGAAGVVGSFVW
jgi:hypothetical protein